MEKFASSSLEESRKIAKDFAKRILAEGAQKTALVFGADRRFGKRENRFRPSICGGVGVKEKIKARHS